MTAIAAFGNSWTSGVCDCFQDCDSCFDTLCCPWCANARQWSAANGIPNNTNNLVLCVNIFFGTAYLLNCCVRCNINTRFGLNENSCESCCLTMFFPWCTMCQNHRELTSRGFFPGGTVCVRPPMGYIPAPPMMGVAQPIYAAIPCPNQPNYMVSSYGGTSAGGYGYGQQVRY